MGSMAEAIETELSPHQREVLVAVALNGVPIDVLAERLNTTRGALYKTIHDARKKLRAHLAEPACDLSPNPRRSGDDMMGESRSPSDHSLLKGLLGPEGPELSCEECFAELDRYVELELRGADADGAVPGMRAHLEGCRGLRRGPPSLRALVEADRGRLRPSRAQPCRIPLGGSALHPGSNVRDPGSGR